MKQSVLVLCAFTFLFKPVSAQGDWRLEFLHDAKVATDSESLRKLRLSDDKTAADLSRAISQLGTDQREKRQAAYEEILRMDREMVLAHLRGLPENSEPEIRLRVNMIRSRIEWMEPRDKRDLMRVAVEGLLYEREHPGKTHPSRQMHVEFFRQPADSLRKGYHRMVWRGDQGLDGSVADGSLFLSGKRPQIEGDQRLVLTAQSATGKEAFPDRLRIDVKIGAKAGGEGGYHVGIAVGRMRALFHPGHDGGGFRFQPVHDPGELTSNEDMGFTPKSHALYHMRVETERVANHRVKLSVEIHGEEKSFRTSREFDASDIGPLKEVSLDRSGRVGGDAIFRDLMVQLAPR